jgi:hypothetical protein
VIPPPPLPLFSLFLLALTPLLPSLLCYPLSDLRSNSRSPSLESISLRATLQIGERDKKRERSSKRRTKRKRRRVKKETPMTLSLLKTLSLLLAQPLGGLSWHLSGSSLVLSSV